MLFGIGYKLRSYVTRKFLPTRWKELHELKYWMDRKESEGRLANDHYEYFYTTCFGIEPGFYRGKRVLDIGCGPRGSLEWAHMAAERVGLDTLAKEYLKLGADRHAMTYVAASCESIPFGAGHFDVVCSFNSLDHVADLPRSISEIVRVLKGGGTFLLLTDVNHEATETEPQEFSWDIVRSFAPGLELVEQKHYEKRAGGVYQSIQAAIPYDHADPSRRYGILSARFRKPQAG